jgi:hypothetical protein
MSQPPHEPDLSAVERALAGLAPSAGAFNRDALLFAAGRQSVRRGWGWPCAAAASTLAAAALAALLFFRPAPAEVVRYVPTPVPPHDSEPAPQATDEPPASAQAPPTSSVPPGPAYLTLRQQAERWGDTGLPSSRPAAEDLPRRSADLLDLPPDVRAEHWLQRRTAMLNPGGPP